MYGAPAPARGSGPCSSASPCSCAPAGRAGRAMGCADALRPGRRRAWPATTAVHVARAARLPAWVRTIRRCEPS